MIRVNLLPPEVQGVSEFKLNPSYVVAGVGVFLILFLLPISWAQVSRRKHLKDDVSAVQNELERYKPIVAQVDQLDQAKVQLQQRKTVIQSLENERLRYPYFMEDFLKLLPNNIWLTNMATTLPASGPSDSSQIGVSMDVVALDHYAVADMVSNLETSQIFSDVDVGAITLVPTPTSQTVTFHINSTYRKGASANAVKKS